MKAILEEYNKWDVFAWKGQCSPFTVTRCFPLSPACYPTFTEPHQRRIIPGDPATATSLLDKYDNENEVGFSSFALTNKGLYTKLLVIRVSLISIKSHGEANDLPLLTFQQANGTLESVSVRVRRIPDRASIPGAEWALGVLDCWITSSGEGLIDKCRDRTGSAMKTTTPSSPPVNMHLTTASWGSRHMQHPLSTGLLALPTMIGLGHSPRPPFPHPDARIIERAARSGIQARHNVLTPFVRAPRVYRFHSSLSAPQEGIPACEVQTRTLNAPPHGTLSGAHRR
ncbi:hypothetical protein CONPUDRAFT_168976 [Coniophora puteana RWD-64-598 SS2]|uniref:Uncharacterized protein n=1 Tax=Coniophora puteana (strain RWD-64-598) TaxID=741705 RepID=A0A5M3MCR2_CONPW|nr:uncharacterized protein CONPUDRAFT_168976 [Coniophora puteana RWD-64-598 SS2]EIW76431.1 hypothetical protein CONPUDRAFT_168976 [Coniophora puteana RWD-64-598 SS2]